jgi:transcriptional regulator of acetoin/glycerol metabolism
LCRLVTDGLGREGFATAAQILGFDRRTMYRKLERFEREK